MKILVTGDRNWKKGSVIREVLAFIFEQQQDNKPIMLIQGGAKGVDTLASTIAQRMGPRFVSVTFPADWEKHGKKAGPIRNREMLNQLKGDEEELVLAFHDDLFKGSKGTRDCVIEAKKRGKPTILINSKGEATTLSYTGSPDYIVQRTVWLPFPEVWRRKLI